MCINCLYSQVSGDPRTLYLLGAMATTGFSYYVFNKAIDRNLRYQYDKMDYGLTSMVSGMLWPLSLPVIGVEYFCFIDNKPHNNNNNNNNNNN